MRENSELASSRSTGRTTRRPTDRSTSTRLKKMEHTYCDDSKTTAAAPAASSTSSCLPLLVFEHQGVEYDDDDEYSNIPEMLMFSISQQSLHRNMEHELLAKNVCMATPQGWVLLVVPSPSTSKTWLWNPQTGDKLSLPDIGEEHVIHGNYCKCLLSHKNVADPACVVVLLDVTEPSLWFCHVDGGSNSGSSKWKHYSYDIGDYEIPPEYRPPTKKVISSVAAFQGKLYFISSSQDMCAVDFSSSPDHDLPEFHYFDVSTVAFPEGMHCGKMWLVESQDELFLVCIFFLHFDADKIGAIHVYKMDFSQEQAWRRVHDIGDSVFLLDDVNIAASCPASPLGLKGNQIYFMRNFKADDGELSIYDLEEGIEKRTQVHRDDLVILCKPYWIVPPS